MMKTGYTRAGFTLIELLITVPLAAFLIVAVVRTYIACARMIDSQRIRNNLNNSVRVSSDYIAKDSCMAGYGLQTAMDDGLQNWVTWENGVTSPVMLTQGSGNDPDSLRICGAFDRITSLVSNTVVGDQTIRINIDDIDEINTTNKHLIYIGRTELARITATNGNQLTISTDHNSAVGLKYAYPSNAPVELVQVITYSVTNSGQNSYLLRQNSAVPSIYMGYIVPWDTALATDVDDLQITFSNSTLAVTVSGKSSEPDRTYTDPDMGDNFRRKSLSSRIFVRNL